MTRPINILVFSLILLCSCNDLRTIDEIKREDLQEFNLGNSRFYLKLPDHYTFEIAHGKEGQKSYLLYPKDSFLVTSIDIEIDEGQRLNDKITNWGERIEKVRSPLLDSKVDWNVFKTKTGRFVAQAGEGKVWVEVYSKNRSAIDTLISYVTTLHRKKTGG